MAKHPAKPAGMVPVPLDKFIEFRDEEFYASKVHDGEDVRVLVFCFRPGQEMEEVEVAPSVVLYAVAGEGFFSVGNKEHPVEPGDLVVVDRRQPHGIRAGKKEEFVVLVAIAPSPTSLIE
ncbi:MAG TPA: cupin domain-containing protein [Candidatus Thermoplasmatota archaeon]